MIVLTFLIATVTAFTLWKLLTWVRCRRELAHCLSWIPGPPSWPVIGNGLAMMGKTPRELQLLLENWTDKYGDIFVFWASLDPVVVIKDSDIIQTLSKYGKDAKKGREYDFLIRYIGDGLIFSNGDKWFTRRKLLTSCFHLEILENFIYPMSSSASKLCDILAPWAESGTAFDVIKFMKCCTLDSMMSTSIGKSINALDNPNSPYVAAIELMGKNIMIRAMSPFYRYDVIYDHTSHRQGEIKAIKTIKDFSRQAIKERIKEREQIDYKPKGKRAALLDLMLDFRAKGELVTDEMIEEECDNFIFAGHDTTAISIAFALFNLGHRPDLQEKIVEEMTSLVPDWNGGLTVRDLNKLELLDRCVKESMRLFSTVPFISRRLEQPLEIKPGKVLPSNVNLMLHFFTLHRDPNIYPDPLKFDPDRFLPDAVQSRGPYDYIPFFAGPRGCIGQKFAMLETKIVVAFLLRKYIVKATDSIESMPVYPNIVLITDSGVSISIKPRK